MGVLLPRRAALARSAVISPVRPSTMVLGQRCATKGPTMAVVHELPDLPPTVALIMGVSGSGKTTVGAMLAGRLRWAFADADDFHSAGNIAKMHQGIPLDDADRIPWLAAIARRIDRWRSDKQHGVATCSALKRSYRQIIIGNRPDIRLVYLKGDQPLIVRRLAARHGHFMPRSLLASQFAALEEPTAEERAITLWVGKPPAALVDEIVAALGDAGAYHRQ
jgi:gluconokinase